MAQGAVATPRASLIQWVLLAVGVFGASASAIFIVYADDAEPMAISFWRCAAGAVALAPFALNGLRRMNTRQLGLPAIAGLFLAAHFATWITSLELTTVAASVLLVCSSPAFVALLAWWFLGERLRAVAWFGVALTVIGAGLVAGGDLSGARFEGNLLAIAGAITVGVYMLAGQISRRELGILEYSVVTYTVAGVVLLPLCGLMGAALWGYEAQTWWALLALLIGPQLLGHTVLNYLLKDLGATIVAVAVMAEPLIASILAYILFDEVPTLLIYPGGAAILAGIYIASTRGKPPEVFVE